MAHFNICTRKAYQKNGEEKVAWLRAGTLNKTAEGKMYITLNHLPNETFYVFEVKPKEDQQTDNQEAWDGQ